MGALNMTDHFKVLQQQTPCPFAPGAKLLTAPNWATEVEIKDNAQNIYPHFMRYSRQAKPSSPDGFVVEALWNTAGSMRRLATSFAEFIVSLSELTLDARTSFEYP